MPQPQPAPEFSETDLQSGRENYLRSVIGELMFALQEILGGSDADGFVSIAAQRIAQSVGPATSLTREELPGVLAELKRRLGGDFYIAEESPQTIVLGNRVCPFGSQVRGRASLCMTTSNILGAVTARHLGYARVELRRTIANGDPECEVAIHLAMEDSARDQTSLNVREYFRTANYSPQSE